MSGRVFLAASLLLLSGCADRASPPATRAPDARVRSPGPPDAAPPVARTAVRRVRLGPGCACAPVPADAVLAHRAARRAFVKRMDAMNRDLRRFMEALGRDAGGRLLPATVAGTLRRTWSGAVCRLDCLLTQFVGLSPMAWTWVAQVARYLDAAREALARLVIDPAKRPQGPGLPELARQYNTVARTSNRSIGIAMLQAREPHPRLTLDGLSFRGKARRIAAAARTLLRPFRERWLVAAGSARSPHPLAQRRVRFRAALARLQRGLEGLRASARALTCSPGALCPARAKQWSAQLAALETLLKALGTAAHEGRASDAQDLPPARCARILAPVDAAEKAWRTRLRAATR